MSIIGAKTTDVALMAAVHEAAFPPAEAWSADVFYMQLALPGVHGLLDDQGGVILFRVAADEAEILTLAVIPEARRRGIASDLLAAAVDTARQAEAVVLFLEVSVANKPSRALYARAGFREIGRRRRYYADGSDALVLRRDLV